MNLTDKSGIRQLRETAPWPEFPEVLGNAPANEAVKKMWDRFRLQLDRMERQMAKSQFTRGMIMFWRRTAAEIPPGWQIADGTNGTWDLRGCFPKGAAEDAQLGQEGGAAEHTPAGVVSAPEFTGRSSTSSAISAGTPSGTNTAPAFTGTPSMSTLETAGTPTGTNDDETAGTPTGTNSSDSAGTPAGTVSQPTFTGDPDNTSSDSAGGSVDAHSTTAVQSGAGTTVVTGPGTHAFSGDSHSHSFTPSGTVSQPTFTGSALGTHTHTFTGDEMAVHTHTFTGDELPPHRHVTVPLGTVAAPTFAGDIMPEHTHEYTPEGTLSQPVFAGTPANFEPKNKVGYWIEFVGLDAA